MKRPLLVDILRYVKLLTVQAMNGLSMEDSGLEDLVTDLKEFRAEWDILSEEQSQEELSDWLKMQTDTLLLAVEPIDLTLLKRLKSQLIRLKGTTSVGSSLLSFMEKITATSSTTVPSRMDHASVSMDSFLSEDQLKSISLANYQKNVSQKSSSITCATKSGFTTLKSEIPDFNARCLLQLKVIDLDWAEEMKVKQDSMWKAATTKMDYYFNPNTPGVQKEIFHLMQAIKDRVWDDLAKEKKGKP